MAPDYHTDFKTRMILSQSLAPLEPVTRDGIDSQRPAGKGACVVADDSCQYSLTGRSRLSLAPVTHSKAAPYARASR